MSFQNIQIDPKNLPKIEDVDYQPLESAYLRIQLIGNTIFSGILVISFWIFVRFNQLNYPEYVNIAGWSFLLVLILFIYYVIIAGFNKKGFALREKDIIFKSGLWWKSVTSIPFNRVQHCEVRQGPLERLYQLAQLNIYTAGGSQSDLKISGLKLERAQALKRFILSQTILDEEE